MNRTALCIQMLQLLKSRGFLTREQIASELSTNIRNISEFRKELETAGYLIESTTGKFGGYRLMNECLLPALQLREGEIKALKEAEVYLRSHKDFILRKEVAAALDKVLSNTHSEEAQSGMYIENEQYVVSERIKEMIALLEDARKRQLVVELMYRSLKDKKAVAVTIHPYEIINYKGAYYCLAYSLKAKDFRNYKFSEERMKDVTLRSIHFNRDRDFDIKKHIGQSGLIKDEIIEVELYIYEEAARLCAEKQIGLHPEMKWIDEDTLYLKTIFEGRMEAQKFILSLGAHAYVCAPRLLQEEILRQIEAMKDRYKEKLPL